MTPAGRRRAIVAAAAISILLLLGLALASGCTGQPPANGVYESAIDGTKGESSSIREITVGPARQECYGPFRRMCLIVGGSSFYDEIDGFTHEPGYEYRLRIERYDAFPGQKEPPQDAGRYGYRLVEVLSKTRAVGTVSDVTVAPTRVQRPKSDERCLLVDGRPRRNSIDGFQYVPGFEYQIRTESFEGGTRRLIEIVDRAPVTSAEVEITVGPWRVGCYENAPITAACIVVNDEPYYGVIEEFGRRHGFEYRLRVERYDLFPGAAEPPPELPRYGYRSLEALSERPASNPPSSN
ncbi:MAG: DUF4377 domain-containing protein [Chloroflexi bacterium]|nr:DUF4377 domain-containing protein [Chloroflexota bacterium]